MATINPLNVSVSVSAPKHTVNLGGGTLITLQMGHNN